MKGNYHLQNVFFTPVLMNATNIGHLLFTINKNQLRYSITKEFIREKEHTGIQYLQTWAMYRNCWDRDGEGNFRGGQEMKGAGCVGQGAV